MAIIDTDYVTTNFAEWEKFCTLKDDVLTKEDRLENAIALAEDEFAQYLPDVTDETLTNVLRRHLLNLVRKQCFDLRHGDSGFENKPQILKDYEATIAYLASLSGGDDGAISITAKPRRFGEWFNETGAALIINSND